ncbi:hypothetical protein DPSP01_013502 [Paraphaeosphaeria sporulosa]
MADFIFIKQVENALKMLVELAELIRAQQVENVKRYRICEEERPSSGETACLGFDLAK